MRTPENRRRYDRSKLRHPGDLTDEEGWHVAPRSTLHDDVERWE